MKLTKFVLPYPVLGVEGAFEDNCVVSYEMDLERALTEYIFHITLSIADETLISLIKNKKASFSCEVDCPRAYLRQAFLTNENIFEIRIERSSLVGKVQLFFSVVAVDSINNYQNPNNNQRFYEGYKFNLQKGHLLAYLGEYSFNADIQHDELKALGTIVEVKETPHEKYTYFDFSGEKIRIFLPSKDFANFNLSNNNRLADITHASIVQCSLISALYEYKKHQNTLWAQTLDMRVKTDPNLKEFEHLDELEGLQICKLVNALLENANNRMFDSIKKLQNNNE